MLLNFFKDKEIYIVHVFNNTDILPYLLDVSFKRLFKSSNSFFFSNSAFLEIYIQTYFKFNSEKKYYIYQLKHNVD